MPWRDASAHLKLRELPRLEVTAFGLVKGLLVVEGMLVDELESRVESLQQPIFIEIAKIQFKASNIEEKHIPPLGRPSLHHLPSTLVRYGAVAP
jgi:hypothetical protein